MSATLCFGPIDSRRLGRSLGVNTIPPKVCTYACVYCQVGRTTEMPLARRAFHGPDAVVAAVRERLAALDAAGERVDHVSIVPDGEPTLDLDLGAIVAGLKALGPPVAVLTNGSLLDRADVRDELAAADVVSVKVDSVAPRIWRAVNRAHGGLDLPTILAGIEAFAVGFGGRLLTETMLVDGLDDDDALDETARFLGRLAPETAYLAVPTRPPHEPWVRPPTADRIAAAWATFQRHVPRAELLIDPEPGRFTALDDVARDVVATCAVHPMREDAARALLRDAGAPDDLVDRLVDEGVLERARYQGHGFYVVRPPARRPR